MFPLTDFPSLQGIHYLNTAAESIPPLAVHEAVAEYMAHKSMGMRGRDFHFPRVEACREITAKFLGLTPAEVSFVRAARRLTICWPPRFSSRRRMRWW